MLIVDRGVGRKAAGSPRTKKRGWRAGGLLRLKKVPKRRGKGACKAREGVPLRF